LTVFARIGYLQTSTTTIDFIAKMTNRHQRRANQRQQRSQQAEIGPVSGHLGDLDEHVPLGATTTVLQPATQTHKPHFMMRILAKVLLSRWVLNRVKHADVERLLMTFATEAGRPDVADELVRRQAMRAARPS
jgi:hypothetical protein